MFEKSREPEIVPGRLFNDNVAERCGQSYVVALLFFFLVCYTHTISVILIEFAAGHYCAKSQLYKMIANLPKRLRAMANSTQEVIENSNSAHHRVAKR